MELMYEQKSAFFRDGYIKISNVVPQIMVEEAIRAINHSLGSQGLPPEKLSEYGARSYAPELCQSDCIVNLYQKTPAKELLGSLLNLEDTHPVSSGQIALRFPNRQNKIRPAFNPHLDGTYAPLNSVNQGEIRNFTALVGVLLSDLPRENAGNFIVWPGTHRAFEQYYREHGADSMISFKDGLPPVELPQPVQVTGKAGDIVIAHYSLAHTAMGNYSPYIRYATFFRIKHKEIQSSNWQRPIENIWMHWSGMQEIVQELG